MNEYHVRLVEDAAGWHWTALNVFGVSLGSGLEQAPKDALFEAVQAVRTDALSMSYITYHVRLDIHEMLGS